MNEFMVLPLVLCAKSGKTFQTKTLGNKMFLGGDAKRDHDDGQVSR